MFLRLGIPPGKDSNSLAVWHYPTTGCLSFAVLAAVGNYILYAPTSLLTCSCQSAVDSPKQLLLLGLPLPKIKTVALFNQLPVSGAKYSPNYTPPAVFFCRLTEPL